MKKRRNTLGKRKRKMEEEEDNNNSNSDSETTEGESDGESEEDDEGSEGGCKDPKRGNYGNGNADDDLVTEEKDNPLEVPNDELEAQFNACVMKHRIDKIKKGRKGIDSDGDDNDSGSNEESNDENCESTKGQTQEKRKRGRPPKKKIKTKQCH